MDIFYSYNTKRWIDISPSLVDNYSNFYHRPIKMKQIEASTEVSEKRSKLI